MTTALTLMAGAAIFFMGFVLGSGHYTAKPEKSGFYNTGSCRSDEKTVSDEYRNFLDYEGLPQK